MSEIRETNTIDEITAPPSEPLISLADLLAGAGWLTYHGVRLTAKAALKGGKLAAKGISLAAQALEERNQAASDGDNFSRSEIDAAVMSSPSASEAIALLATHRQFVLPRVAARDFQARFQTLAAGNDKRGVVALARELVDGEQDRRQKQLLDLVREGCQTLGFRQVKVRLANGLVLAQQRLGREAFSIEVAKTKEGGLKVHFDASGFHGGACAVALDKLEEWLKKQGVKYQRAARRRKEQRPVADGRRLLGASSSGRGLS